MCGWQSSTRRPHEVIEADPYLQAMHANAEQFDTSTERLFRYLQASTAHSLWMLYVLGFTVDSACLCMPCAWLAVSAVTE